MVGDGNREDVVSGGGEEDGKIGKGGSQNGNEDVMRRERGGEKGKEKRTQSMRSAPF